MQDLIFHIGYPKTGTTTMQQHWFCAHPQLIYLGKPFADPALNQGIREMAYADTLRYDGAELRKLVGTLREQAGRKLMISTELITSHKARDPGIVAERLVDVFSPCRIMITLRSQPCSVRSYFVRNICKNRRRWIWQRNQIRPWLEEEWHNPWTGFLGSLHYHAVYRRYVELLGPDAVGVFLFEQFVHEPMASINSMSQFLQIDPDASLRCVREQHENRSESRSARLAKQDISAFHARFDELYGEGNVQLERETGLPLSSCGYPMLPTSSAGIPLGDAI